MIRNLNQKLKYGLSYKIEAKENQSGFSPTGHNDEAYAALQAFINP